MCMTRLTYLSLVPQSVLTFVFLIKWSSESALTIDIQTLHGKISFRTLMAPKKVDCEKFHFFTLICIKRRYFK